MVLSRRIGPHGWSNVTPRATFRAPVRFSAMAVAIEFASHALLIGFDPQSEGRERANRPSEMNMGIAPRGMTFDCVASVIYCALAPAGGRWAGLMGLSRFSC